MIKNTIILFIALILNTQMSHASALNEAYSSNLCNRYLKAYEKKYRMPKDMLKAIAITESGKWSQKQQQNIAWPWTINVGGKGYHFKTRYDAINAVKKFQKQGKTSIDIGCMQINLKYHPTAFRNINQAFEPRFNVGYAAKFLARKYNKNGDWETAIRHYHNIHEVHSDKYIVRVYKNWQSRLKNIKLAMLNYKGKYFASDQDEDSVLNLLDY